LLASRLGVGLLLAIQLKAERGAVLLLGVMNLDDASVILGKSWAQRKAFATA
jgi:hypothetical protein